MDAFEYVVGKTPVDTTTVDVAELAVSPVSRTFL